MLKRLSYSLSGCDYDLYDQGGNILLRVRGSGLRPDYLNSYYDVENKEIFRVWTPPPLHYRAEAFRPHTTKDPIWNIENGRSRSRDKSKLYLNFLDVAELVLDDGDDDDDEMREVAVARMRFEIKGNKQKWRVDISSNFDYSLVIAMAVSLTTLGYDALIQVDP
nr:uncharacterized protein I203_01862 [Kwoniella mangroviensis CBS 8507]OCF68479.1 hypothetical protein I203_01862 [Kwoniella mangroviensis CBS 8507]